MRRGLGDGHSLGEGLDGDVDTSEGVGQSDGVGSTVSAGEADGV